MTSNRSGIYSITNNLNGDSYIGQSVNLRRRKSDHFSLMKKGRGVNPHFQNAWNKYGADNFSFEIVLYCEPFELTHYEQCLVDRLDPAYNICRECVDSTRGVKHTEEQNRIKSEAQMGHTVTAATRLKISAALTGELNYNFGKPMSEEQKLKLSEAMTGTHPSANAIANMCAAKSGENNPNFGKPMSEEQKPKLSAAGKGNTHNRGRKHTDAARANMSAAQKRRRLATGGIL